MFFRKKPPEKSKRRAGDLDYTLVRSGRRTLALQIREGELVVRAPHKTPVREIEDWIFEKRAWIARHRQKAKVKAKTKPAYRAGALHPYLGQRYPLRLNRGRKSACDLLTGEIRLTIRGEASPEKIKRALKKWYAAEAKAVFEDRLTELYPPFEERGHKRPEIRLRWMKSRWGSMGSHGKMTLNAKLVKKDLALVDYVIVHELCHMEHMNHGRRFYKLMDQMLPGWKPLRKQLKGDL